LERIGDLGLAAGSKGIKKPALGGRFMTNERWFDSVVVDAAFLGIWVCIAIKLK